MHVKQAIYIMDDNQTIHHLVNDDGQKFVVVRLIDFSWHDIRREMIKLRDTDWIHTKITQLSLSLGGKVYSLETDLEYEMELPTAYFGEEADSSAKQSNYAKKDKEIKQTGWYVESSIGLDKTTGLLAFAQK